MVLKHESWNLACRARRYCQHDSLRCLLCVASCHSKRAQESQQKVTLKSVMYECCISMVFSCYAWCQPGSCPASEPIRLGYHGAGIRCWLALPLLREPLWGRSLVLPWRWTLLWCATLVQPSHLPAGIPSTKFCRAFPSGFHPSLQATSHGVSECCIAQSLGCGLPGHRARIEDDK